MKKAKSKELTATIYGVKVLPNTIEELVVAIYDQKGKNKIGREEALEMADYLERKQYERKPLPHNLDRFGPLIPFDPDSLIHTLKRTE